MVYVAPNNGTVNLQPSARRRGETHDLAGQGSKVPLRIHSSAIRYFDAVRRAQSIREAARQLNVASSAVNRQIIKLEEEIGEPLFHRLSTGLVLTPVGEALARHVITVFQDLERTGAEIDDMHGASVGHITVAVVESVASSILPHVIGQTRARAPRITFTVSVMGSFDIPAAVVGGEADVGVAFALRKSTELQQVFLAQFRLGAIVRPDHPLANNKAVTLSHCLGFPMILATPDLSINNLLEPLLSQGPTFLSPVITSGSIDDAGASHPRPWDRLPDQRRARSAACREVAGVHSDRCEGAAVERPRHLYAGRARASDRDRQLRAGAQGGNPPTPAG
jgi:DNA-binding transcriptional LysR family regulator